MRLEVPPTKGARQAQLSKGCDRIKSLYVSQQYQTLLSTVDTREALAKQGLCSLSYDPVLSPRGRTGNPQLQKLSFLIHLQNLVLEHRGRGAYA